MKGAQKALAGADVPSLAEQLSKLAQQAQAGQPGDKADREQLARQLAALAKALEGTRLEKASEPLQQAAEALKRNDLGEASRTLQEAARRASEAAQREEDLQSMRQMASALQNGEREGGEPGAEGRRAFRCRRGRRRERCLRQGRQAEEKPRAQRRLHSAGRHLRGRRRPGRRLWQRDGERKRRAARRTALRSGAAGRHRARGLPRDDRRSANGPAAAGPGLQAGQGRPVRAPVRARRGDPEHQGEGAARRKGPGNDVARAGAPDKAAAHVPYYDVYGQYAPAAESALNREDIPATYKRQVKDYFDALRPEK
jgi:hypothetical protein